MQAVNAKSSLIKFTECIALWHPAGKWESCGMTWLQYCSVLRQTCYQLRHLSPEVLRSLKLFSVKLTFADRLCFRS